MAKKTKKQNQRERLRKSKQWVAAYQGSDIISDYCKRFRVHPVCAEKDLAAMGAAADDQREKLRQEENLRKQTKREETSVRLLARMEKHGVNTDKIKLNPAEIKKAWKAFKANKAANKKPNPKRRCVNCGKAMKQQFIGLKHCKCGTSWRKDIGYFERTPDMVFALERRVVRKSKNSIKAKQFPIIRYKPQKTYFDGGDTDDIDEL